MLRFVSRPQNCSLTKATKSVLDKIELENRTAPQITFKERIDRRLLNPVAIREAIINAIVHNDFTREVPPKFEIFSDRMEITSAGTLPEGLSREEFFDGVSIPRNRELMRVYRNLELVEQGLVALTIPDKPTSSKQRYVLTELGKQLKS